MAGTCDPQLAQSERTAGFSSPTGVQRAIRPFQGKATPENIVDYINREQFPVIHAMRSKVNEVYLPSKLQAPSANPLGFVFDVRTAGGDPGTGFVRLNAVPENTATILRVSQLNAPRRVDVATWLSVMQGSVTSPLGVITVSVQADPTRFIRANLTSMIDQGTYWDLGISIVESSHPNPFVDGSPVQIGFIAGVAQGGVSLATSIATGLNHITVSAGASSANLGSLVFSNGSGVSFGLSGSTITGSVAPIGLSMLSLASLAASQFNSILNGTDSTATGNTLFLPLGSNSFFSANNVFYRISGNTLLASASVGWLAGASNVGAQLGSFANGNGISFGMTSSTFAGLGRIAIISASLASSLTAINVSAGATSNNLSAITFSNGSNVSFGLTGSTLTASVASSLTAINVSAGATSNNLSALTFSNGSNVSFGLTGSTLTASVASSLTGINVSASGSSNNLSALVFSNGGNVTFGLTGSTITANAPAAGGASFRLDGGGSSVSATRLIFADNNAVNWLMSTAAGVGTVSATAFLKFSAGLASNTLSQLTFSNSNNVSFGLNGSVITASATVASTQGSITISAGASSVALTNLVFTNTNNVGFAISTGAGGGTVRAAASIQITAGTTNGAQSVLSFADGNGVSFGLNGSTLTASVAAAAAGGIAIADALGDTASSGTVLFTNDALYSNGALNSQANANVVFSLNASRMQATALMAIMDNGGTTNGGNKVAQINFVNSNGITWGVVSSTHALGRIAQVTASAFQPTISSYKNHIAGQAGAVQAFGAVGEAMVSVAFGPLDQVHEAFPGNITADTFGFMMGGFGSSGTSNSTLAIQLSGGVYTLVNSTQLSIVNSFSVRLTRSTEGAATRGSALGGTRYMSVGTAGWSSSPVFSYGAQYWFAWMMKQTNVSVLPITTPYKANANPAVTNAFLGDSVIGSANYPMFGGILSTTGIPGSIAASQIVTLTSVAVANSSQYYIGGPALAINNGIKVYYP